MKNKIFYILLMLMLGMTNQAFAYNNPNSWKEFLIKPNESKNELKSYEPTMKELIEAVNEDCPMELNPFMTLDKLSLTNTEFSINATFITNLSFFVLSDKDFQMNNFFGEQIPRIETLEKVMALLDGEDDEDHLIYNLVVFYLSIGKKVKIDIHSANKVEDEETGGTRHLMMRLTLDPDGKIGEVELNEVSVVTKIEIVDAPKGKR